MKFLLSNRLFDRYLFHGTADQRSRQVIALTLKSPVMPCAALVIAKSERKIFLWIDFDSGARDCELTKVTESIRFDQLSNRLIDSVSLVNSSCSSYKFKGRVTATIRLCSLIFAQFVSLQLVWACPRITELLNY